MNHRPLADDHGYRGIEYGVFQRDLGDWQWAFYPKVPCGVKTQGSVRGNQSTAVAACKAAIDAWLGACPSSSGFCWSRKGESDSLPWHEQDNSPVED